MEAILACLPAHDIEDFAALGFSNGHPVEDIGTPCGQGEPYT
jgi:hypothetical protein